MTATFGQQLSTDMHKDAQTMKLIQAAPLTTATNGARTYRDGTDASRLSTDHSAQ